MLRPGDAVQINVWRKPELSGEFFVAADGSIGDPFYAAVNVTSVPFALAVQRVRDHVAEIEASPMVWVEPLFRVMVGGEVRQPNLYPLRQETTIAEAVAIAGGPTERGRADRVTLIREGRASQLDLTDPSNTLAYARIRSGDQIMIGRRANILRDYVAPASSLIGAVASVVNVMIRWR
jgi:protein involved in polysaccharide export with SLBB domain